MPRYHYERRRRKPSFRSIRPYALFTLSDGREVLVNRAYTPIAERGLTGPSYPPTSDRYENIAVERWLKDPPDLSYWGPASPAAKRWCNELMARFRAGQCIRKFIADSPIKLRGRPIEVRSAKAA